MKKILLCAIFVVFLCGCGREIDDIAYVVAIGVDKADIGYEYTFAIGNPDSINSDNEDVLIVECAVANDIFSAGDEVSARIGQDVNFSHAELLVFSESVATDGVGRFLDALTRNLYQRPKLVPAVSRGSAKETLLSINSRFEGNPEKYLKKVFEVISSPVSIGVDSREFLCRTKNNDISTAIPRLDIRDGIVTTDMSVFCEDCLAGEIGDIFSYKLLSGLGNSLNFDADEFGSVHLSQRVPPSVVVHCKETPEIDIAVDLDASVNTIPRHITADALYGRVESMLEERFNALLNQTASLSADVFGFERYARRCFLTWNGWAAYDWKSQYGKAKFNLDVNLIPRKTGLVKGET